MQRRMAGLAVGAVALALLFMGGRAAFAPESGGSGASEAPERRTTAGEYRRQSRTTTRQEGAAATAPSTTDAEAAGAAVAEGGGEADLTDAELAELEEKLLNDPNTQVVCDVGVPMRRGAGYLAIGGHSDFNGRRVEIVNGKAYMPLVYDLGELGDAEFSQRDGLMSIEGYGPASVSWGDRPEDGHGACTAPIDPEPGRASLTGTLTLAESGAPAAGGWVEGCGNMAFADERGVVHMDIVPQPCTLLAMRQDGLLRTISDPVPVTPTPGQDVVVDIVIPEAKRGGLGVQLSATEDGDIRIDGILETGPAGEAGLAEGDLVVEVDGQSTEDMDLGEFVKQVGGEAGTDVGLVVDRDGQRLEFTLTREALSPG